jgi:hypothetical protein
MGVRLAPQPSTSNALLHVHGTAGYPQVIHNLCNCPRSLPGRMVGRLPEPVLAREQAHRAERFTALSGFG